VACFVPSSERVPRESEVVAADSYTSPKVTIQ